jgi:bifunctional DNase/RNase
MRIAPVLAISCVLLATSALGCRRLLPTKGSGTHAPHAVASPPAGYVEAHVLRLVSTRGGEAVLVADAAERRAVPIFIGGSEALAIELRLEGKKFKRPLTHDLLADTIRELGGRPVQVQVDDLIGDTYYGTAVIERGDGSTFRLDARPSDCIALALGARVPIYMRKHVLDTEGLPVAPGAGVDDDVGPQRGDPLSL